MTTGSKRDSITAAFRVGTVPRKDAPKAMREALKRVRMYRKHVKRMIEFSHKWMKKVGDERWNLACDEVCGGHGGENSPVYDWLKLESFFSAALIVARSNHGRLPRVFLHEVAEEMARFSETLDAVMVRVGADDARLAKLRESLN